MALTKKWAINLSGGYHHASSFLTMIIYLETKTRIFTDNCTSDNWLFLFDLIYKHFLDEI